jgi:hypothetical protein
MSYEIKSRVDLKKQITHLVKYLDSFVGFENKGNEDITLTTSSEGNTIETQNIISCQIVNYGSESDKVNEYKVFNFCHQEKDKYSIELLKFFKSAKNKSILSICKFDPQNDDGIWYKDRKHSDTVQKYSLEYMERDTVAKYERFENDDHCVKQWDNWVKLMFKIYPTAASVFVKNLTLPIESKSDFNLYSGIFLTFACQLNFKQIGIIGRICETLLQEIAFKNLIPTLYTDMQRQATKAAISQVMARNMSHNIGSHVLSRLVTPDRILEIINYKPNNYER